MLKLKKKKKKMYSNTGNIDIAIQIINVVANLKIS